MTEEELKTLKEGDKVEVNDKCFNCLSEEVYEDGRFEKKHLGRKSIVHRIDISTLTGEARIFVKYLKTKEYPEIIYWHRLKCLDIINNQGINYKYLINKFLGSPNE